ncbi:hypothetical protein ACLOJK_033135 [Asimina triloba]
MKTKTHLQNHSSNGDSSDSCSPSPSPPSSPRRPSRVPHSRRRHHTKAQAVSEVFFGFLFRRCIRAFILLPLFYISGVLMCAGTFSFLSSPPPFPGSVYRSDEVFRELWPKMQSDNASGIQVEAEVCNAVALAGLLDAVLVIPQFNFHSIWQDPRQISLMKTISLALFKDMVIRISPFANRLALEVPPNIQCLRCLANYKALQFAAPIESLGKKLVNRMIEKSSRTNGKYVSIHLRFEEDMVAFSCCEYNGGRMENGEMKSARERAWKKFNRKDRIIRPGLNRMNGRCPMSPVEMFPLLQTKESLATPEELAPFKGYSSSWEVFKRQMKGMLVESDRRGIALGKPKENVVSWTALMSAYTRAGQPSKALSFFTRMLELEVVAPNSFTYSAALKACALTKNIEMGRMIHGCISESLLASDTVLTNAILDMYVKCETLSEARKVFDQMYQLNLTSWNIIIDGYCREGQMEEAKNLFNRMPEHDIVSWNTIIVGHASHESPKTLELVRTMHGTGLKLDQFTLPSALKVCGCLRNVKMGEQAHCYVVKSGLECSCFIQSSLIDMYAKCSRVKEAIELFNEFSGYEWQSAENPLGLFNSIISGLGFNEQGVKALNFFLQAHSQGVLLDHYTFSSVLKVCISLNSLKLGIQFHGLIVTYGYQLDSIVGSILTDFYAKCGDVKHALQMFEMLPEKDVVAWTGLISGCARKHLNSLAFSLFRKMVVLNLEVDQFVSSSLLKAFSSEAGLQGGKQVHAYCVKCGYESERVIITSLVDMYSKCGEIEDAMTAFRSVMERDVVCWTGIIVGCGQNGRSKEAIGLFMEMQNLGLEPNAITFLGVLSACRHSGLVAEACSFFASMVTDHRLTPCLEHYCCMVDLLGRVGCFEEVERLIANMPYEPNETILGSLLGACVLHKNVELGKRVANRLLALKPGDASIYVTLSNAYATTGMWKDLIKLRELAREASCKEGGRSWIEGMVPNIAEPDVLAAQDVQADFLSQFRNLNDPTSRQSYKFQERFAAVNSKFITILLRLVDSF